MAHFRYGPCDLAHGPTGCGFLPDGLDELFANRLASLAEIEKIVADARRFQAAGKLDGSLGHDRYLKQLAAQGDGLLERAASARTMYEELKRVADSGRSHRNR